jgi:hypothetical protein
MRRFCGIACRRCILIAAAGILTYMIDSTKLLNRAIVTAPEKRSIERPADKSKRRKAKKKAAQCPL